MSKLHRGMSNKLLVKMAARVLTGFPNVFEDGEWVGNPVKSVIVDLPAPQERFATRSGALKLAVIGGSFGRAGFERKCAESTGVVERQRAS